MNQAVFCVTPISFESWSDERPLRAVTTKYITYTHLLSGTRDRSKAVPVRTVNSPEQSWQR